MLSANNITLQYGKRVLFDEVNIKFNGENCYGVIGANGAGKTTLFRLITKEEQPNEGEISIGDTVSLNYVDQSRDILKPNQNVWESICDGQDEKIGRASCRERV